MSASLPCIPRLASAPIVAVVQKTPATEIVEGTAGLRASCLSADNALAHNPPAAAVACGQSDTDDDSEIAASVTRLVSTTDCIANQLSPRLSLRLSVDASGMFAATGSALGLSAFVAPFAAASAIPEEETPLSAVEETTVNADSVEEEEEEDPVRARLRSLRSRRLANPTTEDSSTGGGGGGRRFRATQSARGGSVLPSKQGEKPLAKMGNLQLDRLTKLNTRRNSTYMTCRIERYTVVRDGARPPSPSSAMLARAQERKKTADSSSSSSSSLSSSSSSPSVCESDCDDMEEIEDHGGAGTLFVDDVRPLTPMLSSDSEDEFLDTDGALSDGKRKSVEMANNDEPAVTAVAASLSQAKKKKLCCRKSRVQWGSRSVLRATWMVGRHHPVVVESEKTKPILVNRTHDPLLSSSSPPPSQPSSKPPPSSTATAVAAAAELYTVRVACIEYPAHITDDEVFVDANEDQTESGSSSNPDDSSSSSSAAASDQDEYMPRRSSDRRKKKAG
ncbi:hypothetical protein GGI00_000952 [Coemansia sp. RSA 2681]|nr:hypothetical protein GGI00_000952 [Coemansia sp. RSA 2681]